MGKWSATPDTRRLAGSTTAPTTGRIGLATAAPSGGHTPTSYIDFKKPACNFHYRHYNFLRARPPIAIIEPIPHNYDTINSPPTPSVFFSWRCRFTDRLYWATLLMLLRLIGSEKVLADTL
jgi:hypothetical protein